MTCMRERPNCALRDPFEVVCCKQMPHFTPFLCSGGTSWGLQQILSEGTGALHVKNLESADVWFSVLLNVNMTAFR